MTYLWDGELLIRTMSPGDAGAFAAGERAQGWPAEPGKYELRLRDQEQGRCLSLTAEFRGWAAGYVNLYFQALGGPFADQGIPEIVDFGVLEKFQRRGIGSRLMDVAEELAACRGDMVCLGVGLHRGYGNAQRMYVKRGYVPDGSGVWYRDETCPPGSPCRNDDELVLYLAKKLR